jgi:hypothetical protein
MPDAVITPQELVAQEAFARVQSAVTAKNRVIQSGLYAEELHAEGLGKFYDITLRGVSSLIISRGFADRLSCIIALLTLASKHGIQDTPWDSVDMEVRLACFQVVAYGLPGLPDLSPCPVRAAFNALSSIYTLNIGCSLKLRNPLFGLLIPYLLPILRDRKRDPRHMSQMQLEILKLCLEFGKSHLADDDDKELLNVSDDDVLRPAPTADDLPDDRTMFLGAKLPRKRYCYYTPTQLWESCLEKIAVMTKEGGGDVSKLPIPGTVQSWVEGQGQIVYLSDLFEIILEYLMQLSCEEFEKLLLLPIGEPAVVDALPAAVPSQLSEVQESEVQSPAKPR